MPALFSRAMKESSKASVQPEGNLMKVHQFASAVVASVGIAAVAAHADAQTLKKVSDTNKITVSYRESSVPFSYTTGSAKAVGFAVDLTEAIVADVKKEVGKPNLEVVYVPVSAQTRIPMLVSGAYDLECGSTTNTASRGKEVQFAISHFFTGTRLLAKKGQRHSELCGSERQGSCNHRG